MYQDIARFYDLIHQEQTADVDFILGLAQNVRGPILELGCGTGRVLLPLAQAGHMVTGLDSSDSMLKIAQMKVDIAPRSVRRRVNLISGNMMEFDLSGEFGLVFLSYNSLMHLARDQVKTLFDLVRRHLKQDGLLFMDVENPVWTADDSGDGVLMPERTIEDHETGDTIRQLASGRVNHLEQMRTITWIFDVMPAGGGEVERTETQSTFHYLYPHEMELLIREAGLSLVELHGDYDRSPYSEESPRLLILATRL